MIQIKIHKTYVKEEMCTNYHQAYYTLLHKLKLLTVGAWTGVGSLITSNGFVDCDGCGKLGMDCNNGKKFIRKCIIIWYWHVATD